MTHALGRRELLAASGVSLGALIAGGAAGSASAATAPTAPTGNYTYEVTRTQEEWRTLLGDETYTIMREVGTEVPRSSPLWNETRPGNYFCKGCELQVYDSRWKVILEKGWAFFRHAEPDSVLLGLDWPDGIEPTDENRLFAMMEAHCRRCGSHLGHVLHIENKLLHCINGASMTFTATAT